MNLDSAFADSDYFVQATTKDLSGTFAVVGVKAAGSFAIQVYDLASGFIIPPNSNSLDVDVVAQDGPLGNGVATIGDLTDVDLTGLAGTNVLVYNSGTGNFEPGPGGTGGSGTTSR